MKDVNFIIPCAGKGTRLGIPTAKELFPLSKGETLVDRCFSYIRPLKGRSIVTVVISDEKTDLVKYLKRYADEFDIAFVYQKDGLRELTGAIASCKHLFLKSNVLLLPDIYLEDEGFEARFREYVEGSVSNDIQYLYVPERDFSRLSKVGALKVEGGKIVEAEDKPKEDKGYDSYWVSLSFSNAISDDFLREFRAMQQHSDYDRMIWSAKVYEISYAIDLGVWENIKAFNERKYENESHR